MRRIVVTLGLVVAVVVALVAVQVAIVGEVNRQAVAQNRTSPVLREDVQYLPPSPEFRTPTRARRAQKRRCAAGGVVDESPMPVFADPAAAELSQARQEFNHLAPQYAELMDAEALQGEVERVKTRIRELQAAKMVASAAAILEEVLRRYPHTAAAQTAERMKAAVPAPATLDDSAPAEEVRAESSAVDTGDFQFGGSAAGTAEDAAAEATEVAPEPATKLSIPLESESEDAAPELGLKR